jgi:hypothetical protein
VQGLLRFIGGGVVGERRAVDQLLAQIEHRVAE